MSKWITTTGTLIGPYHIQNGTPNQDSSVFHHFDEYSIFVVADGAGSQENSHIGSHFVANRVVELFDELNNTLELDKAIEQTIESVRSELIEKDVDNDLGCTLSFIVVKPNEWGIGQVGDSFIVIETEDGLKLYLNEPAGEYANITKLLTSDSISPYMVVTGHEEIKSVIASSDGLTNISIKNREPFEDFWRPLIEMNQKESLNIDAFFQYLNSKDRIVDDTTLIIATRVDQ